MDREGHVLFTGIWDIRKKWLYAGCFSGYTALLVPPMNYLLFIIIHYYDHPHTHLSITRIKWRTVDPTVTAFGTEARHPLDPCCYAAAIYHCLQEFFAHGIAAADSGEE